MKGADLVVDIGSKPMGGKSPMGKDPMAEADDESKPDLGDGDSFDGSVDEFMTAFKSGDMDTAKDALKAAIAAKCADMYSEEK